MIYLPRASSMRESSLSLVPKLSCDMSKSSARLDLCSSILSQLNTIQTVQLNHEMAVFSAKSQRSVTVSTALGINSDTMLGAASNSSRDLSDCCRDSNSSRLERKSQIVGGAIFSPGLRASGIDGDFGLGETAVDSLALCRNGRGP
jgi:hypothetical protein